MNQMVALLATLFFVANFAQAEAVTFSPSNNAAPNTQQIKVAFPQAMMNVENAFSVNCNPAVKGDGYWADNNTTWVYNFEMPQSENGDPRPLLGGTTCSVTQNVELKSVTDNIFAQGTLQHKFDVAGPFMQQVLIPRDSDYNRLLNEDEPVMMVVFTGDIDRSSLLNGGTYLTYGDHSAATADRIGAKFVPQAQAEAVYNIFADQYGYQLRNLGIKKESKRWAIITFDRNLIPGSKATIWAENIVSDYNPALKPQGRYIENLQVRDNFKVEVACQRAQSESPCQPNTQPSVQFNAAVPWKLAKNVQIEYVPNGSESGQAVTVTPKSENVVSNWLGSWVGDFITSQIDFLLEDADATIKNLDFSEVMPAPNTQVKVTFPKGLVDRDGRPLNKESYVLSYGDFQETIRMATGYTTMERMVPANSKFPILVMNLNQQITFKMSGSAGWQPIKDVPTMISLLSAQEKMQWVEKEDFQSPMDLAGVASSSETIPMKGGKNQLQIISPRFATNGSAVESGMYAIEVQSSLADEWTNPRLNVTMVTDLSVHLRKGKQSTLVWVTSMSSGEVIPNAAIEVYGCDKALKVTGQTDAEGLFQFSNGLAPACDREDTDDNYLVNNQYFVVAKTQNDLALTSSSQRSSVSSATNSPGVEWFSAQMNEGELFIHPIIGVNLVKPGQTVPVKLVANYPSARGFGEINPEELPESVEIQYSQNEKISYKFDLQWENGVAEISWKVPKSAELGSYRIGNVVTKEYSWGPHTTFETMGSSDIEVSEFKIPLMTARLDLPQGDLVQPQELKVSGLVQYANGVGAKDLDVSVSYYFSATGLEKTEGYTDYNFARGKFSPNKENQAQTKSGLPSSQSAAEIADMATGQDGSLTVDIASQLAANDATVASLLASTTQPQNMVVKFKYKDQMGEFQTLSSSKRIYNSPAYIGSAVAKGAKAEARLKAVNLGVDGKAYTNMADLEMNVVEVKMNVIGEEVFGGFIKNNVSFEVAQTGWKPACASAEDGSVQCEIGDLDFGSYIFEVASKTTAQVTYTKFTVDRQGQVQGERGGYYEDYNEEYNLLVKSDKENYDGGDVAKLSFESPFTSCAALVTTERSDVFDTYIDMKACENGYVTVPVDGQLAPNVFASVYLVTPRVGSVSEDQMDLGKPTYRLGFSNLKIDWSKYAADVEVAMDKEEYKPGEQASISMNVKAQDGEIENGKATVIVIEEKILELKENKTMELLAAMMGLRPHSVSTINTYELLESAAETEGKMMAEAAMMDEAKGGDDFGDGGAGEFNRKFFDALVAWKTDVPVVNGQAQVDFKTNDSLTKFKVFAVIQGSNNKFGTGSTGYLSTQELQTYPNIPPVSRTGDKFPVTMTLQNNGKVDGTYTVTVDYKMYDANGKLIAENQMVGQKLIPSASSKPVDAGQIEVKEGTRRIEYSVVVTDANGVVVDRVSPEAQTVLPAIPLSVQDEFMAQIEDGELEFTMNKSPKALPGQGMVDAQVFSSLVDSTRAKVKKDILAYPFADLTIENRLISALVKEQGVEEVFAEMISQLDSEGFIKYYSKAPQGSFWMTAEMAKLIGAYGAADKMPESLKANMMAGLEKALNGQLSKPYLYTDDERVVLYSQVKALNAMAAFDYNKAKGHAGVILAKVSALTYDQWPASSIAEMAQAYTEFLSGKMTELPLFKYINSALIVLKNKTAVIDDVSNYSWWGYSDETISAAKIVQALSKDALNSGASSADHYLDNLIAGMVNSSRTGGWYNMRTRAWVLAGMMEFGRTYESEPVTGETEIKSTTTSIGGKVVWGQGQKDGGLASEWKDNLATVKFVHGGAGKPWASVQASAAVKLEGPNYKGIKVEKVIKNLTREDGTYKPGDLIQVDIKLTVNGDAQHVALVDPIPGGSNILADGWGGFSSAQKSYSGYKVYFSYLGSGETSVSYQYQLNNPGKFNIAPTRAEALYEPGFFGEVPNATMEVAQ